MAALAGASMLVGCAGDGPDTVTIGAVLQLTGRLAESGRYYRDGYQIAVDRINQHGGITIGEGKYKLVLKLVDNRSESNLLVPQLVNLITKDQVHFLLGPYSSYDVLAASTVAEKYQVPMVQAGGASSRIFSRGYRQVFGMLPVGDSYFHSTIEMLQRLEPRPKTVGMISGDDPFDITLANATRTLLGEGGFELIFHQQYSERNPNFDNILTLMRSRTPDVLLWSGHEAAAVNFIRQSKRRNVSPNLLASYTVAVVSPGFRGALGNDANLAFGMTPWLANESYKDRWFGDAAQFATAFAERFGYAPDYHAAAAVAAVQALAVAMESAHTFEAPSVRDALARVDFESVYGRVHFGPTGQIERPLTVVQIQSDEIVEIFADDFVNRPVYPVPPWDERS